MILRFGITRYVNVSVVESDKLYRFSTDATDIDSTRTIAPADRVQSQVYYFAVNQEYLRLNKTTESNDCR